MQQLWHLEDKAAAFQSHAKNEINSLLDIAKSVDEKVFELPITDTEKQLIRNSDIADLVNHTNGQGKALFAAAFITHFSGLTPHIHFDIAGPATINKSTFKRSKRANRLYDSYCSRMVETTIPVTPLEL